MDMLFRLATILAVLFWAASASAEHSDLPPAPEYNAAVKLQDKGEYKLAAPQWADFLRKHPTDPRGERAGHDLGVCLLRSDQLEPAADCFRTLIRNYPKSDLLESACLHLGVTQLRMAAAGKPEMYDAAAATFETLLKDHPRSPSAAMAMLNWADCLAQREKKREAADVYARLAKEHPDDALAADALYALGVICEELREPDRAAEAYDCAVGAVSRAALAAEATLRRGETMWVAGRFGDAAEWFAHAADRPGFVLADRALARQAAALVKAKKYAEAGGVYAALAKKFPQSPFAEGADLSSGKCYRLAGNSAEGKELLKKSLAAGDEAAPEAAHWLADVLLKENHPTEAVTAIDKGLAAANSGALKPRLLIDRDNARYALALGQLGDAKFDEAAETLRKLLQDNPRGPLADRCCTSWAGRLQQSGKRKEAVAAFAELAKTHADSPWAAEAHCHVGEAAYDGGDFRAATAAYRLAIDKAGKSALGEQAAYKLAWACFRMDDFEGALKAFRRQREAWPGGPLAADAAFMEAECLLKQKQFDAALAGFVTVVYGYARSPRQPDACYEAARCCEIMKNPPQALRQYEELIEKFPESAAAPLARERVRELGK